MKMKIPEFFPFDARRNYLQLFAAIIVHIYFNFRKHKNYIFLNAMKIKFLRQVITMLSTIAANCFTNVRKLFFLLSTLQRHLK